MLARVAENMYWLSRYLERAENTIRLIRVHSHMLLDLPEMDDHTGWIPLISINALDEQFLAMHSQANEHNVIEFLLSETENPGSVANVFSAIRNNLRSCRDIVPRSSYEGINGACREVNRTVRSAAENPGTRSRFFTDLETRLLAISGGLNSNMTHDLAYRFMRLGCYLERADMTSRIIDVQSSRLSPVGIASQTTAVHQQRWVAVLRSLSAMQMYRQHVRRPINGEDTLNYLLCDNKLPRSYRFCIDHLSSTIVSFKEHTAPLNAIQKLREELDRADLAALSRDPAGLHDCIDQLQKGMLEVGSSISETYFLPAQAS